MQTLILAKTRQEAVQLARELDLPLSGWRHASSAQAVVGGSFSRVIELASFKDRPDRYAILSAVKRNMRKSIHKTIVEKRGDDHAARPAPEA